MKDEVHRISNNSTELQLSQNGNQSNLAVYLISYTATDALE